MSSIPLTIENIRAELVRRDTTPRITPDDISAFTEGSCYQLAEAVRDATGWPMYAFWDYVGRDYDIHAFVKTPRGTFLDIEGEHSRYRMLRDWAGDDGFGIRRVKKGLRSWDFGNPYYDSMPRARRIVPALLARYENQVTSR
jgi:hypothetical protein